MHQHTHKKTPRHTRTPKTSAFPRRSRRLQGEYGSAQGVLAAGCKRAGASSLRKCGVITNPFTQKGSTHETDHTKPHNTARPTARRPCRHQPCARCHSKRHDSPAATAGFKYDGPAVCRETSSRRAHTQPSGASSHKPVSRGRGKNVCDAPSHAAKRGTPSQAGTGLSQACTASRSAAAKAVISAISYAHKPCKFCISISYICYGFSSCLRNVWLGWWQFWHINTRAALHKQVHQRLTQRVGWVAGVAGKNLKNHRLTALTQLGCVRAVDSNTSQVSAQLNPINSFLHFQIVCPKELFAQCLSE